MKHDREMRGERAAKDYGCGVQFQRETKASRPIKLFSAPHGPAQPTSSHGLTAHTRRSQLARGGALNARPAWSLAAHQRSS